VFCASRSTWSWRRLEQVDASLDDVLIRERASLDRKERSQRRLISTTVARSTVEKISECAYGQGKARQGNTSRENQARMLPCTSSTYAIVGVVLRRWSYSIRSVGDSEDKLVCLHSASCQGLVLGVLRVLGEVPGAGGRKTRTSTRGMWGNDRTSQ
jgi:hypothetical protein